jgi:hypothetical protein
LLLRVEVEVVAPQAVVVLVVAVLAVIVNSHPKQ